jgi:teichuronic acid exporter
VLSRADTSVDIASLAEKMRSGLLWAAGGRLLTQIFTWAVTIVVIRLLTPGDYGLLAMATVFSSFLVLLAEAGLGMALVQARDTDHAKLPRVLGAVIVIDVGLCLVQLAAAPVIAAFFGEERLTPIIRVLAVQFLLMIFAVIPVALLTKALDFKRQSVVEFGAAACGSVATLVAALAGWGVWAIVAGTLIGQLCRTAAINWVAPCWVRPQFSFAGLREMLAFGGQVTGARVLWFVYSQADIFVVGKVLGTDAVGSYSVAMQVASMPVQKLSAVVNQVAFPAFAQAQHAPETVRQYLLKGVRLLSFVAFPLLWGISSIAGEIVTDVLGAQWSAAVIPLTLLTLVMPLSMLSPFLNAVFHGTGHARVVLHNVLTASLVMPAAFYIGAHWGLNGLSCAWLVAFPVVFALNLRRMLPIVGLCAARIVAAISMPLIASVAMYAAVAVVRHACAAYLPAPTLLVALISTGATVYCAVALALDAKGVREMAAMVRRRGDSAATVAHADLGARHG